MVFSVEDIKNIQFCSEKTAEDIPMGHASVPMVLKPAFDSLPIAEEQSAQLEGRDVTPQSWSSYRLKRLALNTIGGALIAGSAAAITAGVIMSSPVFASMAPPLGVLAYGCFCKAHTIIDYMSQKELSAAREKARSQSLQELSAQHGFDNLFTYGLLTPEEFETKFNAFAAGASFSQVLSMYKQALDAWMRVSERGQPPYAFRIPDVRIWSEKFDRDLETLSGVEFFSRYKDLETLKDFDVISPQCCRRLKDLMLQFESAKKSLFSRKSDIQSAYTEQLSDLSAQYNHNISFIQSWYSSLPQHAALRMLDRNYEELLSNAFRELAEARDEEEALFERIQASLFAGGRQLCDLTAHEAAVYDIALQNYHEAIARLDGLRTSVRSQILRDKSDERRALTAELEEAKASMEERQGEYYRHYQQESQRLERAMRRAIEQQVTIPLRTLERELNQRFDRLFA